MLFSLSVLLVFQLLGEALSFSLNLPIPGPVIGMLLLLVALQWRGSHEALRDTASQLLSHLSLLFVPAGVGIITYGALLRAQWWPILAALVVSTVLTLVVTASVVRWLARRRPSRDR